MPTDTRIAVLVLFPVSRRQARLVDPESLMELRQLADDLRTEGIRLIPWPLGWPWGYPFPFPDIDDFEEWLEIEMVRPDWDDIDYWFRYLIRDWSEPTEMRRYYRAFFPDALRGAQRLIERRKISGVVLLTSTRFEEYPMEYELLQISELLPPRSVLHLEMGRPEREERPLLPGVRSLRFPESRDEIRAALRSLGYDRGEEAEAPPRLAEAAPPICAEARPRRVPAMRRVMELAARAKSTMSGIRWKVLAKPKPDAVHLGASAPTRARPGDEFTARFSPYHPAFAKVAKKALRQLGSKARKSVSYS